MSRSTLCMLGFALAITSCGGGGGGGDNGTATLTLSIKDAPVDGASAVVVEFTGVELKPAGGGRVMFDFATPRQIDLLALQGNASTPILDGVEVPAGDYNWIRLAVNAERGVLDSYIELEGGAMESLFIPSGAQTGLKLHTGFTIAQGSIADFTIDFDLRKSVHDPEGQPDFYLRPTLRLIDNLVVGTVRGTVAPELVTDASCTNGANHDMGNAVYLYAGVDAAVDDVGSPAEPLTSVLVELDEGSGDYVYEVGFVAEGDYTVAFTCQAADDDPATDDDIAFVGAANVSVTANQETTHDF
jgi:hypothetical protein